MRRVAKVNYSTPDSPSWRIVCDQLFMAQFLGRPCEVCGATSSFWSGKTVRSHAHHLLSKELHRLYRYSVDNIVVLCPKHHLGADMSPHSHDTAAQAAFFDWLQQVDPKKYTLMMGRRHDKFDREWCYREKYVELGGEISSKTGNLKDMRPVGHAAKIRRAE